MPAVVSGCEVILIPSCWRCLTRGSQGERGEQTRRGEWGNKPTGNGEDDLGTEKIIPSGTTGKGSPTDTEGRRG